MEDNAQNCCRICLDVESRHIPILDDSTINLHIKSCLSIHISTNDRLPKLICDSCVSQLNEFYNFQLNARCSQDWLESSLQEKSKKSTESKPQVQPLPDSEYNSDSLLEFLNNTENIEEYLNNLGKEDIPSIVNMLDRTENADAKIPSPKKKNTQTKQNTINMDIDVLDSDFEIVKELMKKTLSKNQMKSMEKLSCFACKTMCDTIEKLSHHLSICDKALRTCVNCNTLFDSKQKMRQHLLTHSVMLPLSCNCGKQFKTEENLFKHCRSCKIDHLASMGFEYLCKQCGETFNERFLLYKHAKEHVRKLEEKICDVCGHKFVGDDALSKHRKEEHNKANNLLYRCKVCSFTSVERKKIYSHVLKHTQQVKQSVRHLCESCGRSFTNHSTLRNHSLQHAPKDHKCQICEKGFTDLKSKEEHLLEHIEMVMCEKCGQSVNSLKLDKHVCV